MSSAVPPKDTSTIQKSVPEQLSKALQTQTLEMRWHPEGKVGHSLGRKIWERFAGRAQLMFHLQVLETKEFLWHFE